MCCCASLLFLDIFLAISSLALNDENFSMKISYTSSATLILATNLLVLSKDSAQCLAFGVIAQNSMC